MVTKDLNAPHLEPDSSDPIQIDQILQAVRLVVARAQATCPGFDRQIKQLLMNKERAVDMSKNNLCWNCGQAGHMRSRCPHPRRHHSTDFHK
jgi:hypothetical protein